MSFKITCDVCGDVIPETGAVNVFRMFNVNAALMVLNHGISHFASDEDYYICDRCFKRMVDCVEEMKKL